MKVKELTTALTKYYEVIFVNEKMRFEDQSSVYERLQDKTIANFDFYANGGELESIVIYTK